MTRCALVTGAAGGIGGAVVAALRESGWSVAANHLPGEQVDAYAVAADVSDLEAVTRMVAEVERAVGAIELLVNCAGYDEEVPLEEIAPPQWQRMLHVHLGGTYNTCRAAAPKMRARGKGVIVNIASELAISGSTTHPHYVAAKGAILGLTRALAKEFAPTVRINAVAPGPTDTPLLPDAYRQPAYLETLPLRRLSTAADVAALVEFLASDDGSFFTGQTISPNSGAVI